MSASSDAAIFQYKPLLLSIAIDILGNFTDAEDAVQDTFLRWLETDTSDVNRTKPYLITILKNICLNVSKQTQSFREFREEMLERTHRDHFLPAYWMDFDLDRELARAYAMLCRKLNMVEKAVFLLREVFNLDYQDIAQFVDKKAENCRKIFERAKKQLGEGNERLRHEADRTYASFQHFKDACRSGSLYEMAIYLRREMQEG